MATLIDIATGDKIAATGTAVEPDKMASMAPPQITGTASTYARKRALEGLFLLDNEKDVDSKEVQDKIRGKQNQPPVNANSGQDSMKQAALKGLNERVKALGVSAGEVTNIIHRQYNKPSSKEMSTNEIADLANNLKKFIDMGMGA
jgi:hypothetical protein